MKIKNLKEKKIFTLWKWKITKDGLKTKVPMASLQDYGSATDSNTWDTYLAKKYEVLEIEDTTHPEKKNFNVGFVFNQTGLVGIDIDKIFSEEYKNDVYSIKKYIKNPFSLYKAEHQNIKDFVERCSTYTEVSPSKTGLHLLFWVKDIDNLHLPINKKSPFEIYSDKRFFTFSENEFLVDFLQQKNYEYEPQEIREISTEELDELLKEIGLAPSQHININNIKTKDGFVSPKIEFIEETTNNSTSFLSEEQILKRMFLSKKGPQLKQLYDGNLSNYNNDESSADLALVNNLLFFSNGDIISTERLWLKSGLGQRFKTQNRKDYRERTINTAKNNLLAFSQKQTGSKQATEEAIEKQKSLHTDEDLESFGLTKIISSQGAVSFPCNVDNVTKILKNHSLWKDNFRLDTFSNKTEIMINEKWEILSEDNVLLIMIKIQEKYPRYFSRVSKDQVREAIRFVSFSNPVNTAEEWVKKFSWDKTPRLEEWLAKSLGLSNSKYLQETGRNFILGIIARIVHTSAKVDTVLVLEGKQGIGKSSLFRTLVGEKYYSETTIAIDNKDFFLQLQGKLIVEFSEGEILSRSETKKLKSIITQEVDRYRAPFAREVEDHPRRCVFAMTTNDSQYLKDETGNRRWLPVKCKNVDLDWIKNNKEQLFAEAYIKIKDKEKWYIQDTYLAEIEQEAREIEGVHDDLVLRWWASLSSQDRQKEHTLRECFEVIFKPTLHKELNKNLQIELGKSFIRVLKLENKRKTIEGVKLTYYYPTPETPKVYLEWPADRYYSSSQEKILTEGIIKYDGELEVKKIQSEIF